MRKTILHTTLTLAVGTALLATPAQAFDSGYPSPAEAASVGDMAWQHGGRDRWDDDDDDDDRRWRDRRHRDRYYGRHRGRNYDEPIYRDTRVWRGRDGRTYCRKRDGTTGLIVGGALGAIIGREVDSRGDRSLGTILGAAGGALLGREVARGRCR